MKKYYFLLTVGLTIFGMNGYSQNTCGAPTVIGALPYTANSQTTCNRGADYGNGVPACMLGTHSNATDIVYTFTPGTNMCISISVTGVSDGGQTSCPTGQTFPGSCPAQCTNTTISGTNCICNSCNGTAPTNIGLYLLNACPTTANVSCMGISQASFTQAQANGLAIQTTSVTAGTTYYIVLDVGKVGDNVTCANFNISVTQATCPPNTPPPLPTAPQGVECGNNLGFENGNLTGWTGCRHDGTSGGTCPVGQQFPGGCPAQCTSWSSTNGVCTCNGCGGGGGTPPCCPLLCGTAGIQPANGLPVNSGLGTCNVNPATTGNSRHTIMTGPGLDPNSNGQIPVVAPGGRNFSVRIGNHEPGYQAECLTQTFPVTKANALFTYLYAVVLQDPAGHADDERPRFEIKITDQAGNSPACGGIYTVISKNAAAEGFVNATTYQCGNGDVWYKKWTAVATDLSAYIGQNMTIRFCTADCGQGGHYGYAYVDTYCKPLEITGTTVCTTGGNVTLTAPPGFSGYSWYSGGVPVSGGVISPTYTMTVPGTTGGIYTVKMSSISTPGCFTFITDTVVTFSASASGDTILCTNAPGPVTLKTTSTNPAITTYSWSPATGLSCTNCPNPTLSPPYTTRTYTVTFTSSTGCTMTDAVTVTANPCGISVVAPPATLCAGACATLTATASGGTGPYTYTWSPGGFVGNPLSVCPSVTTTYTVSARDSFGESATATAVVTINPNPVITATPQAICLGSCTSLSASGAGIGGTYTWSPNIGTGAGPHSVCPTITTTYTVSGTTSAGCTGSTTVIVTVNPNPVITVTSATICVGDNATLTATGAGPGGTYTWSNGVTGPSITVSPSTTTCYTVTGTDVNGCTGSATTCVTVNTNITITVPNDTICLGGTGTLVASGPNGTTYSWSTGQTGSTITVTPGSTTTYSVIGTSPAGCTGTTSVTVVVTPLPQPGFTSSPVCLGLQTCFTNTSTIPSPGTIIAYSWDFGDGGNSNQQNPCYTYASSGTFIVSLTVTSNGGCTGTYTSTAVVNPLPVAAFSAAPACLNQQSCFTDQSTTGTGTITAWTWTFGDASPTVNVQNPCHIYPNPGTYNVCLIVENSFGCRDTICGTAVVNPLPVANFTVTNVCQGQTTSFTDLSTVNPSPPNAVTQWLWNFGDNVTSTLQNPTHTYTQACTYTVTLTATTNNGCISNTQKTVEVYPNPIASFTANAVCQGTATQFTDLSSIGTVCPGSPPPASTLSWNWNFGDPASGSNNTSTLQNPSHIYPVAGNYVVTLTVTTNHGCISTYSTTVIVHPPANPLFTVNRVCLGNLTQFTDGSSATGGTITAWSWNFGDPASGTGDTSTLQNPTHVYSSAGTFNISLTVTTSFGCLATYTATAIVDPIPLANFTFTEPCVGLPSQFSDGSTVPPPGGIITSWSWNFGDNGTSNLQNPTHTYTTPGSYNVTLVVTTAGGCIDTIVQPVNVWPTPVPYFGPPAQGCKPLCVTFRDSSTVAAPSTISAWSWNFGDPATGGGNVSSLQNPQHCYMNAGTYSPSFTVTTDKGCTASLTRPNIIQVWPFPSADFSASPQPTTIYEPTINFRDLSGGNPVRWYWTFEDAECQNDSLSDTIQNPVHTYCDTGRFDVCLVIWNQYGCPDTVCKVVIIGPEWTFYIPNAFTPNKDGFNDFFIGKSWNVIEHQMWIFDRWGNMIYTTGQTKDPESAVPWDGRANGGEEPAQEDVYVWVVKLKDIFGKSHKYIGHVTLVK